MGAGNVGTERWRLKVRGGDEEAWREGGWGPQRRADSDAQKWRV